MSGRKRTEEELQEREVRAADWKKFMGDFLLTEKRLAELICVSRRTVQMVKAAKVTPHNDTLRLFETLRHKYVSNQLK